MNATKLIAGVLGIAIEDVTEDLRFQSIPQWDSLAQVELMVQLEKATGAFLGPQEVAELTSFTAIRDHLEHTRHRVPLTAHEKAAPPIVQRGLHDVVFAASAISEIDGVRGRLTYRGHSIHDLVGDTTFEEVAFLLLYQHLPRRSELIAFRTRLAKARVLPLQIVELIKTLRHARPMTVLRTAISALGAVEEQRADRAARIDPRERLFARVPTILATHQAFRSGAGVPVPEPKLGFSENLLAMLGLPHDPLRARLLDVCLIVQAEHGASPSAFAARVATGTEADIYAAITAAIGTFDGPLHGGATARVTSMVEEIGSPDRVGEYVRTCREKRQPVMGLGHRVYRTEDPRARHLKAAAYELSFVTGQTRTLEILQALHEETTTLRTHGMDVNVDFYAGAFYEQLGIPDDLAVPVFVASRVVGWLAHIDEQLSDNVLIRPALVYAGNEQGRPR